MPTEKNTDATSAYRDAHDHVARRGEPAAWLFHSGRAWSTALEGNTPSQRRQPAPLMPPLACSTAEAPLASDSGLHHT